MCFDGDKDFLHESGIADSCEMFNRDMPLNGQVVNMRSVACKKINELRSFNLDIEEDYRKLLRILTI